MRKKGFKQKVFWVLRTMIWKLYVADCPFPSSSLGKNNPQLTYFVNFRVQKRISSKKSILDAA